MGLGAVAGTSQLSGYRGVSLHAAEGPIVLAANQVDVSGGLAVQGNLTATGNITGVRCGDLQFKPTTDAIPEGTSAKYYSDARARLAVSSGAGLAYNSASSVLAANAASTSQPGVVQLSDSTNTASSTLAATATAVKASYDLAASRVSKAGDTVAGVLSVSAPAAANALVVTGNLAASRVYR
jgi:hypothetical protein